MGDVVAGDDVGDEVGEVVGDEVVGDEVGDLVGGAGSQIHLQSSLLPRYSQLPS